MALDCSTRCSHSVFLKRTVHFYGVNIINFIHEFVVVKDEKIFIVLLL